MEGPAQTGGLDGGRRTGHGDPRWDYGLARGAGLAGE